MTTLSPPVPPHKTCRLAITSLVLGVLGFITCGLTTIPSIVIAIVSLVKIRKSSPRLSGKGISIAGICVSIAALIFSILFLESPGRMLTCDYDAPPRAHCLSNLKLLGFAVAMYADENEERLPSAEKWCDLIKPHVDSESIFLCAPSKGERCSYAFNANMSGGNWEGYWSDDWQSYWQHAPYTVLLIDAPLGWNGTVSGPDSLPKSPHRRSYNLLEEITLARFALPRSPHRGGYNVLFSDGHVELVPVERLQTLKWKPEDKIQNPPKAAL